ncbi:MAG: hypothetical protein KGJ08_06800 [Gammaproteobacteria bacterium]|nr:hypothetical protein [Gammaproteobacteria bacterium]
MNKPCVITALIFIFVCASPVLGTPLPTGLEKIAVYAGTWITETGHFATPYSKVGKDSATIKNDCWRSGDYYACNQYVNGKSRALLIYTYDAKDNTYTVYPVVAGKDDVQTSKLIIHGNIWTFPWDTKEKGKTTYFRVINVFTAPDTIEHREEYSLDRVHWYPMAQGYENKIP